VYGPDPAAQARAFESAGFEWLHVIDLDGAIEGRAVNEAAVRAILGAVLIPIQLGGGVRTLARIAAWLESGVRRVILGTIAAEDPALVREATRRHPGRIAASIDARGGRVTVEGWARATTLTVPDLARRLEDSGIAAVIYTDIERDGAMAGVDVEGTAALAEALAIPVIASGGLSSLDDLQALMAAPKVAGVVCGRALYDGRIDARAALSFARRPRAGATR
ncbi:MAG: 1-(5-phosphoribosyl)-5-[(5-phosphoribosylamino)methylideneamino] imidazole-4-carboxamide isomerase, partial [Alphaproteobacteria bacterium]